MTNAREALLAPYAKCEECQAGLDHLIIGGIGDWRHTITCQKCFHIRRGLDYKNIILPLAARQHGRSISHIKKADELAQREYEKALAELTAIPSTNP